MEQLSNEEWQNLILSVGTGLKKRRYSPIEVAEAFERLIALNYTPQQISNRVMLKGTSMINRFRNLLKLREDIKHMVDWGSSVSKISFSVASELARLNTDDQLLLANKVIAYALSKEEVISIKQIYRKTKNILSSCIDTVVNLRPIVESRYLFIGTINIEECIIFLKNKIQLQRDIIFKEFVQSLKPHNNGIIEGSLGKNRFTIVTDETMYNIIKNLNPNFEKYFNNWLKDYIKL